MGDVELGVARQFVVCSSSSSSSSNGLKLNEAKSEVMVVSRLPETMRITANGWDLNQVEEFKYLGVVYDSTAIKETAVNDRINKYSMNVPTFMLYLLILSHVARVCPSAVDTVAQHSCYTC